MSQSKQSVVVRDGKQISSEDFGIIYRNLCDWQTELIVRKWMKKRGKYWADVSTLQDAWYKHCLSLCRQPAGRADGSRGSQQCFFEMSIPSAMAE
eukprot:6172755-Pleurochrysis_carterae.AAC.1